MRQFLSAAVSLAMAFGVVHPSAAETRAATEKDMDLYTKMLTITACNLVGNGIAEFPGAMFVLIGTFTETILMQHGGVVASVGEEPLPKEKLNHGASIYLFAGVDRVCPDQIPDDVREKFQETINSNQKPQ